jgi:hypothetical protein
VKKLIPALALAALSVTACADHSPAQVADQITRAVINNDMRPVMGDFDPSVAGDVTRVRVAELSDELNAQGAYRGLRQTNAPWCDRTGYLCFDVSFAKRPYREWMKIGSDGKVQDWWIHAAPPMQ